MCTVLATADCFGVLKPSDQLIFPLFVRDSSTLPLSSPSSCASDLSARFAFPSRADKMCIHAPDKRRGNENQKQQESAAVSRHLVQHAQRHIVDAEVHQNAMDARKQIHGEHDKRIFVESANHETLRADRQRRRAHLDSVRHQRDDDFSNALFMHETKSKRKGESSKLKDSHSKAWN